MNILLALDEPTNKEISTFLTNNSHTNFSCVADGLSAINAFQKLQPDVIFLDLSLPEIDGFKVLDYIYNNSFKKKPHIIIITEIKNSIFMRKSFELGVDNFLIKPLDYVALKFILDSINTPNYSNSHLNYSYSELYESISNFLIKIGMPTNLMGNQYIRVPLCLFMITKIMLKT